jgi:uncharacterized phiE125 gp8 family phage protein
MTNSLTTLSDAKEYLRITDNNQDSLISSLILAVSGQIEGYCRRNLTERTYTDEEFDGTGGSRLLLGQYPVSQITSVKIDDVEVDPSEYKIRKGIGSLIRVKSIWPKGFLNIKVSFQAGYSEVPADLNLACKHLVMFYYKTDVANFSRTFGEGFVLRPEALPPQIKMLLTPYRKVLV